MNSTRFLSILLVACLALPLAAKPIPEDGPLTIDYKLQALGQRLLQGKQGSIVAIVPATGEVKCMVSRTALADSINRAIEVAYSPGSTFKTAQTLTLLSENIITPETQFSCHKGFWKDNLHIGCHVHHSPLKLIGAIAHSCNSYFCKSFMAMIKNRTRYKNKLEAVDTWHDYMTSMGLGQPLGIDLPGEQGGLVPNAALLEKQFNGRWNESSIMWLGMGQGEIMVTPLQLCNLAAMIANRGFYYIPHIHQPTAAAPLDNTYTSRHQCKATPQSFETVIAGMREAVVSGTCKMIDNSNYQICGKTGTAENPGEDHSIFIGFAPMDVPQIAISVYIENGGFGADLAAPLAALMMEQYITGKLSERSERKVKQWENYFVLPTIIEDEADEFEEVPGSE